MLSAPARWYDSIPSVAHTGPFNPHFVADIGAAFLAAGAGLIARAWRPRYWPAAAAGVGFLGLHALIHVFEIATGLSANPTQDLALVVAPAALAVWAAIPGKGEQNV
jgi:peptidoglycan/LPS O-acetylase OafA/YrhL